MKTKNHIKMLTLAVFTSLCATFAFADSPKIESAVEEFHLVKIKELKLDPGANIKEHVNYWGDEAPDIQLKIHFQGEKCETKKYPDTYSVFFDDKDLLRDDNKKIFDTRDVLLAFFPPLFIVNSAIKSYDILEELKKERYMNSLPIVKNGGTKIDCIDVDVCIDDLIFSVNVTWKDVKGKESGDEVKIYVDSWGKRIEDTKKIGSEIEHYHEIKLEVVM